MKNYVISILACAIICSIACSVFDNKSSTGRIIKILTGILMTATILIPLKNFDSYNISGFFNSASMEANEYVEEGKKDFRNNVTDIIKSRTEAYILDKAKSMELDISVEVELSDENSVPCGIKVTGSVAPYEKNILSDYIEETLGIPKENQKWT